MKKRNRIPELPLINLAAINKKNAEIFQTEVKNIQNYFLDWRNIILPEDDISKLNFPPFSVRADHIHFSVQHKLTKRVVGVTVGENTAITIFYGRLYSNTGRLSDSMSYEDFLKKGIPQIKKSLYRKTKKKK